MPPGSWVIQAESLRQALAEIKEAQDRPQQKIEGIVPQIAFERIVHRAVGLCYTPWLYLLLANSRQDDPLPQSRELMFSEKRFCSVLFRTFFRLWISHSKKKSLMVA